MNLQHSQSGMFSRPDQVDLRSHIAPASPLSPLNNERPLVYLNLRRALQLHLRLALAVALIGLAAAAAYTIWVWPLYKATSQIYIQPVQPKVLAQANDQTGPMNPTAYDSFVQQQIQNATNSDVLIAVLHKLGPGPWQRSGETDQVAAERLGRSVEAVRVGTGYNVAITARAKDPSVAANIANAVAACVVEKASGEGNAGNVQRVAVLREERDRIQSALNADYAEQDDLNRQLGMAAVGTTAPDLIDDEIAKTREELIKAQTDHDQAEARFAAMQAGQGSSSTAINAEADDLIGADAGLTSMKTSLNQRRAVLITQMANLTLNNPAYKQDAQELAKIDASLDSMMKDLRADAAQRIEEKLHTDLERTAGVETRLNGQLRRLTQTAAGATPKLQRVNDLAADIVRLRTRFTAVDEQLHNFLLEDSAPGAVHLAVSAVPPLHPAISQIAKKAVPLALGGLLLALLIAVIVNKLDPRIYIAADVEHALGFAPMAVLPDFDEVSAGVAEEHILRLAAAIEQAFNQGDLKSCIFTGAAAGVGVTTLATRVKDRLLALGRSAILADTFGAANTQASTEAAFQNQPEERSPQSGPRATALMKQVPGQSKRQESLVLVDAAPLAISAQAERLARSSDGAILVVESGATTRTQLLDAIKVLRRFGVGAAGVVLNRVQRSKADPAFRRSIQEAEQHLRTQGSLASLQHFADDSQAQNRAFADRAPAVDDSMSIAEAREQSKLTVPEPETEQVSPRLRLSSSYWRDVTSALSSLERKAPNKQQQIRWWLPEEQAKQEPVHPEPEDTNAVSRAKPHPEPLPDWFWERGSGGSGDFTRVNTSDEKKTENETGAVDEQVPLGEQSRLHQLRGMFMTFGLRNLGHLREGETSGDVSPAPEGDPKPAVPSDKPSSPSISAQVPAPAVEPPSETPSEPLVTAKPEILPPREFIPMSERQKARARRDQWDAEDDTDIQILPSRRGQYRK